MTSTLTPEDQQRLLDGYMRVQSSVLSARDIDLSQLVAWQLNKSDLAGMSGPAIEQARKQGRLVGLMAGLDAFTGKVREQPTVFTEPDSHGATGHTVPGGNDGAPQGLAAPQLTREDLQRLFREGRHDEIDAARRDGRLAHLMGVPAVIDAAGQ